MTSRITFLKRPHHFRDEMIKGIFKFFKHDHFFDSTEGSALLKDELEYALPFGVLGKLIDIFLLKKYLTNLLQERAEMIKSVAETEQWKNYVPDIL